MANDLSARRTETRNDAGLSGPRSERIASEMASMSSGVRPARAKLATPNTRETRSRTVVHSADGPSTISIRPISGRTSTTPVPRVAARRLCTSRVMNHGPVLSLERDLLVVEDEGLHRVNGSE